MLAYSDACILIFFILHEAGVCRIDVARVVCTLLLPLLHICCFFKRGECFIGHKHYVEDEPLGQKEQK